MNEYDDILNRIVEEFYNTGKVVLNELDLPDELQLHSSEEQKKLNKELVQNLIDAKRTDRLGSWESSKGNYENFLPMIG
jgi:precorrin-6B methylase 2